MRSTLAGITVDYLPRLYEAEVNCSQRLLEFAKGSFPPPKGLERMIQNVAEESGIEYSEEQTRAIREAATSGLLLITGGPGTGKTTILNGILSLLGQMQLACLLAAPTGRAAKRLTEVTGRTPPPSTGCWKRESTLARGTWCSSGTRTTPLNATR